MPKAALKLFGNPTDSSSPNGPQLPLGVVMQCSDDGANECADQSSCLHMVTFKDEDWSTASDSQRADVLAKHGFICETLVSQREYAARPGSRNSLSKAGWHATLAEASQAKGRRFEPGLALQLIERLRLVRAGPFLFRARVGRMWAG